MIGGLVGGINLQLIYMSVTGMNKVRLNEDTKERYEEYIRKVADLPTIPHVLMKVMTLLESPDTSSNDLEKVISLDQSLTSKVIRLANSPFYYTNVKVSSVKSAVVNIGFNALKNVVLAVSVISMFKKIKSSNRFFSLKEFWKHSVGVGIASKVLAENMKGVNVDDCLCGGILHDVGKLVINLLFPEDFAKALGLAHSESMVIREVEEDIFTVDHTFFGSLFAKHWNFSDKLTRIISDHHLHPGKMDEIYRVETSIVKFSDFFIRKIGYGFPGDFLQAPVEEETGELVGIGEDSLKDYSRKVEENIERAQELINLA